MGASEEATSAAVSTKCRIAPLSQTYDMAFRFSNDWGESWVYADMNDQDLAYDVRDRMQQAEKAAIGRLAASRVTSASILSSPIPSA